MNTLKLKPIYQETIFLNSLGLDAETVTKLLDEENVGTITTRYETLMAKILHPDEPQSMPRVIAKLNEWGIIEQLHQKFAIRFAKEIKDAKKLPVGVAGVELVG